MAGIWDAYNPSAAAPSEDRPWYSDAYEVGRQGVAGAVVDLPRMAGQAARWVAPDGTDLDEWGRSTVEAADARAPGWEPDMQGRGGLAAMLIKGSRAIAPRLPAIAASFVPGGQWIAPAVAVGQFGTSSAQDTEDKLRKERNSAGERTISDEDATSAGWRTGMIQGPLEGLAIAAGGWALRGAKPLLGIGAQTTSSVAARMTDTAVLKPLAKGLGLNLLVQPTTEVAQDLGTEFNERAFGAAPEDAWEIAKDSAQGAVGLTLLLGPFAAGGQVRRAQRADQIKQALYNPATPEPVRAQVRDMVVQAAGTEGVGPQDADAWLDEQFQADDARFAADQAREDAMIARTAQGQYEESVRQRAAQNKQDRADIRALMTQRDTPLGEIAPAIGADTQGEAAISQTLESNQQAQAEREQAAVQAAEQAAVPPTPEQIEEEAAAQAQVILAQEATAFIQQNQITAKNALPVVKEMLSSPDVMTPALRGAMRGALVTGDVNGARKMLVEAKKAQLKAQQHEQKIVEEGLKAEQANDEFAARMLAPRQSAANGENTVVQNTPQPAPAPQGTPAVSQPVAQAPVVGAQPASQTPGVPTAGNASVEAAGLTTPPQGTTTNVPQPAQPGTQTSQAESPQGPAPSAAQPVAEKTPGQELIEKLEARSGKKVNDLVRRRLYLLAGLDPVDGFMVSSPRTMDQVAAIEAVLDGKAKPVSRAAIAKSLKAVGVGGETMDRLADNSSVDVTDTTQDQDEDGTLKERVAPDDNTPALSDDAFGAVMDGDNENPGAMKVRSNLGSGILEPAMTAAQRRAELLGNQLLGGTRFEGARARNEAAVAEATAPAITAEQAAKNRRVIAENAKLIDELNAEIDKSVSLNNLLDHPALIAEVDRAKDEWSEIGVPADGDLTWADMPVAQQAEWVRAFARWDNGVDSDSVYYRNFSEINDAARKTVASRAQGKDTTRVGAGDQNNGERQGSGQDSVAAGAGGNEGRAPAAVGADNQGDGGQPEGVQLDTGGAQFSRAWTLGGQLDRAGQPVTVINTDLVELEKSPGVKLAFDKYRKDGIGHIIDAVEQWGFTRQLVDWSGAYLRVDGKPMMILPQRTLMQGEMSEWTVHHEMGHAVDLTPAGARYSSHPAMSMRIVGNSIRAHGEVMEQVIDYYEANPDSLFSETMAYPLDRTKNGDLDADAVRQEVFAQLWATFNTPVGKDLLYDQMPDVAYFMETVYEDIAQIDFRAENSTAGADGQAAQGAVREARQTSPREGGQDSQQGAGVDGQRVSGQAGVTDTPAFKRWFGDSKVVDADGKPLVVYHATSADFSRFDAAAGSKSGAAHGAGFYFGTAGVADSYLEGDGARLMPVFLNMRNPFYDELSAADVQKMRAALPDFGRIYDRAAAETGGAIPSIERLGVISGNRNQFIQDALKAAGYDGRIVTFNRDAMWDENSETEFIAFEPTQIKSATGNRGTFDPANADIRFSRSPKPGVTDTPAFKRWFGDSKAVDAEGKPLVVYHGTPAKGEGFLWGGNEPFFVFDKGKQGSNTKAASAKQGFFFGNLTNAAHYAGGGGMGNLAVFVEDITYADKRMAELDPTSYSWEIQSKRKAHAERVLQGYVDSGQLMPVYLSLQNPLVHDFGDTGYRDTTYAELLESAKRGGHDGAIFKNTADPYEGDIYVVFEPTQIKSATGNRGTFDPANADIRFSRSPKPGTVLRTIAQLPKPAQSPVRNAVATLGDWANKGLDRVVFTADLIDRAVRQGMKSAKVLEGVLTKRANTVRELEYEVSRIADMYALVPESDRGDGPNSLNRFLFDSTRTGKWGYGKDADAEMGARFDALKPESQALVRAVFDHGARMLADKKRMVLEFTASEYDAEIAYAKANPDQITAKELAELQSSKKADLAKFKTLFALREGIPYAPIKRIGTYAVVAKSPEYMAAQEAGDSAALRKLEQDADHYHVSFVESKNEGRNLRDRLIQDGYFGTDPNAIDLIERDKFSDDLYGGQTMLGALTKLRAKVDAGVAAGDKSSAKLRTMVSELYLQALAEGSARKSEMRRRGIAGEVDMLRSFTNQGRADATFMASVVANPQAQEAIQKMRQESRRGGDTTRKSELFNEIMARYLGTMEVDHSPILNKLTRATSIWFLATSPGYYLQNLTQPWMMSVPAMAGRFGWGKSSSELWKAYGELSPVMQGTKLFEQSFDFTRVPEDTREAIVELAKRGRIDIGMETEMGEFRVEGVGPVIDRWNKIDKGMRLLVQKGESINRLSTGIAAYRLFMQNQPNAKHADAVNYAEQVLSDTHGNYDRFSAPRAFNSKLGKVMLQFRKFQLVQLTFYAKLLRDAYQGNDRKVALRTLAFSLAHTGTMAGVMGLPGYTAVAWLLGMLGGGDDEKFDLTYELRKLIGDEDVATLLLRGAPTLAGVDLSGKIGAGNMLSLMPFSNADITTPSGVAETAGTALGGASLGLAARMLDGIGLMMKGDWYKGIERTMPKGISDAMAAYRMASDGMTRRNGDVILPAEDISEVETIIKALGFATAEQTVVYERRDRAFKNDEHLRDRSTRIKNDYIKAVRGNDNQARNEAIAAWSKLQERRNAGGYRVQPMSELIKAPMEQAKRERGTVGGVQTNRNNQGYVREMTAQ